MQQSAPVQALSAKFKANALHMRVKCKIHGRIRSLDQKCSDFIVL